MGRRWARRCVPPLGACAYPSLALALSQALAKTAEMFNECGGKNRKRLEVKRGWGAGGAGAGARQHGGRWTFESVQRSFRPRQRSQIKINPQQQPAACSPASQPTK